MRLLHPNLSASSLSASLQRKGMVSAFSGRMPQVEFRGRGLKSVYVFGLLRAERLEFVVFAVLMRIDRLALMGKVTGVVAVLLEHFLMEIVQYKP